MFESIQQKVLKHEELPMLRKRHEGQKIVFCTGCFDILQSGHAVFLNQCKDFGEILVVGIGSDSVIRDLKGPGRPVNPEKNRLALVAALQDVNYATLNGTKLEEGKIDFRDVLVRLRPDVFVINDDDSAVPLKARLCEELGIRLEQVRRIVPGELEPTSTTRIIDKINFAWKAPLRIDFAGGWTDVPFIMNGETGFVSNVAIKPLIEFRNGQYNFSGYPRGSGLSTSTSVKAIEMISAKVYNADSKSLSSIAEDLFTLENHELNWSIGRQDQYSIIYGGFHCFEFNSNSATPISIDIQKGTLEAFRKNLLLIHSGASRNAQLAVEQVYQNYNSPTGKAALRKIGQCGYDFAQALAKGDFDSCARIMEENFMAQIQLAPSTSNPYLDEVYQFARNHGARGGKICGAGGGGAFIFYADDPQSLKNLLKKNFLDMFEIDFEFEHRNIKELNFI